MGEGTAPPARPTQPPSRRWTWSSLRSRRKRCSTRSGSSTGGSKTRCLTLLSCPGRSRAAAAAAVLESVWWRRSAGPRFLSRFCKEKLRASSRKLYRALTSRTLFGYV
ncbi:unnamed protein product [Hapterophycus canaliculatus]